MYARAELLRAAVVALGRVRWNEAIPLALRAELIAYARRAGARAGLGRDRARARGVGDGAAALARVIIGTTRALRVFAYGAPADGAPRVYGDTQTLWDQLAALARKLEFSYQALQAYVLAAPGIGVDETTWRLLEKPGGKTWYAWSAVREDAVVYRIHPSRSAEAARKLLGSYTGTAMCDG